MVAKALSLAITFLDSGCGSIYVLDSLRRSCPEAFVAYEAVQAANPHATYVRWLLARTMEVA